MVNTSGCGPEDRWVQFPPSTPIAFFAPVAQRIEHQASDLGVGGSNPSGRASDWNNMRVDYV